MSQAVATIQCRILIAAPHYVPFVGGGEKYLQAVAERLVRRGCTVTVVTLDVRSRDDFARRGHSGLPLDEVIDGVRVVRVLPGEGWRQRMISRVQQLPGGWRLTQRLFGDEVNYRAFPSSVEMTAALMTIDADVIVSTNWYLDTAYWTGRVSRRRGLPHISLPLFHIARSWTRNRLFRSMMTRTDMIVACTEAEAEFATQLAAGQIVVAGAGVDPSDFLEASSSSIRDRHQLGDRPVVGFVGRQDMHKGAVTLVDAMLEVWQTRPDVVLLLAGTVSGRDDAMRERLAALTGEQRARTVLIEDFADAEKPSIMAALDLLALPSVEDAFGIVLAEAWICGKPVIAGDIPSSRCIVEDGVNGWLVPPLDAPALAARITQLLDDPAMRDRFGAHGRAKVLARWTWDAVTDVWEAAIRSVR